MMQRIRRRSRRLARFHQFPVNRTVIPPDAAVLVRIDPVPVASLHFRFGFTAATPVNRGNVCEVAGNFSEGSDPQYVVSIPAIGCELRSRSGLPPARADLLLLAVVPLLQAFAGHGLAHEIRVFRESMQENHAISFMELRLSQRLPAEIRMFAQSLNMVCLYLQAEGVYAHALAEGNQLRMLVEHPGSYLCA